jgi:hypothetical protein
MAARGAIVIDRARHWGRRRMQSATSTTMCPRCAQPASLGLLQHTDEQGHPLKQELLFTCMCGHCPTTNDLTVLWAAAHAEADPATVPLG